MKKIVTALMIVLPLVFLIALFAVTSVASVSADIPAASLRIGNKGDGGIFSFDLANYTHPMFESDLSVEVLPYKAKNKGYSLTVTDAHTGDPSDIVTLNADGSFALNDVGVAKLTYTSNDGGYSDSVVFNIGSSGVLNFEPSLTDLQGNPSSLIKSVDGNYSAHLTTGKFILDGVYYPLTATNVQTRYESDNKSAIAINEVSGKGYAYFAADTAVKMHVVNAFGQTVTKNIVFHVVKAGDVTINGLYAPKSASETLPTIIAPLGSSQFTLYVDCDNVIDNDIEISGIGIASYDVRRLSEVSASAYAVDITLSSPLQEASLRKYSLSVNKKVGDADTRYFNISFRNNDFSVNSFGNPNGKDSLVLLDNANTKFTVTVEPDAKLQYEWSVADTDIAKITSQSDEYCYIQAVSNGKTTVYIDWVRVENNSVVDSGRIERELIVTKAYTSLMFNESLISFDLGGRLAVANQRFDGENAVKTDYATALFNNVIGGDKAQETVTDFEDIAFTSDNDDIVSVSSENGLRFIVKKTGDVTITATWKYGDRFNVNPASITFKAVDGVYVSTYEQLIFANRQNKQIVLENDVYLGENLFDENGKAKYDSSVMSEKLRSFTQELPTTSDCRYYENTGKGHPNVRYCYEFANNIYGNGYMLNTQYITNILDSTGQFPSYAVFTGPLDFVAAYIDGAKIASVKGQDNISFLVRKDNIVLENVTLAGCDDETLYDGDKMELNLLNHLGTTLEIMSDATIKNCRVKNGRTCVRVFGRANIAQDSSISVSREKISVTIDGCQLQTAREFILKVGTNRYLQGTSDNLSPSFVDANGNAYTFVGADGKAQDVSNSSECDILINDAYFVNNYVLTDVTLKDSTLSKSGLFTVGMESHFAGQFLDNGGDRLKGWDGLAATSYPAVLRLVGDVKLEDWKDLEQVDSSTLIETAVQDYSNLKFLSLNVKEMLRTIKEKRPDSYSDITKNVNGTEYVHGGIAFYGGGRNYHIIDMSKYTFENMRQYNVNIGILKEADDETLRMQGSTLPLAAGTFDFRFVMFDAKSEYSPK